MSSSGAVGTSDAAEIDRITNIVIPSAARTVDGAKPKKKLAVFKLQARDLMGRVHKGVVDKVRVIDALHEIAESNGLVDIHGRDAIAEIISAAAKPPRKSDRPIVRIVGNELPRMVDEAEAALIKAGRDIYCYGGQLVRPVVDEVPAADMTRTRIHRLVPVIRAHLVETFTEAILWRRYDGRRKDWVDIDCPDCIAETYLAREGAWKLPPLVGVINAPMLRADGSLLDTAGYDAGTGLLYRPDGVIFGPVPEHPSKDDADRALCLLEDLISTFPFAAEVDRAVAISAILSALDRRAVPTSPLHAFTSPVAGSGKSMLVDICSAVATGRAAPVLDQSREDIETDKRLAAALLRGSSIISIDNCERPLDSSMLCQALTTAGVMRIRPLGVSKDIDIPNTAMFYATGNNLAVVGDLTRRVVVCRLDPKCERPELREFQCDPLAMVAADRPTYVIAALTVLRAYLIAEDRVTIPPVGSYEG
jgi:putative DNA primase/helicase